MKKFDLTKYSRWCEENGFDTDNPNALKEYTERIKKEAQEGEKTLKIAKQKEIFEAIAKYCDKNIKYDERAFEGINGIFDALLYGVAVVSSSVDSINNIKEIDDLFFGGKRDD